MPYNTLALGMYRLGPNRGTCSPLFHPRLVWTSDKARYVNKRALSGHLRGRMASLMRGTSEGCWRSPARAGSAPNLGGRIGAAPFAPALLDYLIGQEQEPWGERQAEGLGGLQVNDQIILHGDFHG
jgi:hypothetical protein